MFPVPEPLAGGANSGKNGLVTDDGEAGLFGRNLPGKQHFRHINIDQRSADVAVNMIVSIGALVEAAGLVSEWEFEDQPALGKQMQGAVDRPIGDRRIPGVDPLEDFASREMAVSPFDLFKDRCSLRCHPEV